MLSVPAHRIVVLQLEVPADEGDGGVGEAELEDLEERDERADERPDSVAEDAQLVGEDRRREEADHHDADRDDVVRRDVAAVAHLLEPAAPRRPLRLSLGLSQHGLARSGEAAEL